MRVLQHFRFVESAIRIMENVHAEGHGKDEVDVHHAASTRGKSSIDESAQRISEKTKRLGQDMKCPCVRW